MIPNLQLFFLHLRLTITKSVRPWLKPATGLIGAGMLADLTHSRTDLLVANAILCQQLIILNRQVQQV